MNSWPRDEHGLPRRPAKNADAAEWQRYAAEWEQIARAGEARADFLHARLNAIAGSTPFKLLRKARNLIPRPFGTSAARGAAAAVPAVRGEPLVSILIPFRDGAPLLRRCLKSLAERTAYERTELILIDNGSRESATRKVLDAEGKRERVKILRVDAPFNYSMLNNRAAREARGDFLLLLNNDTEALDPHWLHALLHAAQQERVGAVGAKLLYPDGRIQHAGVQVGLDDIAAHPHRLEPGDAPAVSAQRDVDAVTGACLLTPRALYEELGGLDEARLPVAYNDIDYCLRLRERDLRVVYTPHARLIHHETVSRAVLNDPAQAAYMVRRWAPWLNAGRAKSE